MFKLTLEIIYIDYIVGALRFAVCGERKPQTAVRFALPMGEGALLAVDVTVTVAVAVAVAMEKHQKSMKI